MVFQRLAKVVKCPTSFGSANSAEDQSNWLDFAFSFKQWLVYAEPGFETDLKHVEDHLNVRSCVIHCKCWRCCIWSAFKEAVCDPFRSFATTTFEAVEAGAEQQWHGVWRQLCSLYTPKTKSRALGILSAAPLAWWSPVGCTFWMYHNVQQPMQARWTASRRARVLGPPSQRKPTSEWPQRTMNRHISVTR